MRYCVKLDLSVYLGENAHGMFYILQKLFKETLRLNWKWNDIQNLLLVQFPMISVCILTRKTKDSKFLRR